ncbi:outer membrane beta-barrel protein [Nitratifractor sp.]
MKKLLLPLACIVSLQAADHDLYRHSLELVGGYAFNSDDMVLKDGWEWGFRYNYNLSTTQPWEVDAVQFAFDYQFRSDYVGGGASSVYRWGANALWYADNPSDLTPYALLGVGAQFFSDEGHGTDDGLFAAIGAGIEYQIRGDFSLVGEAKYLYGGDESALLTTVGVKYSFGQ